MLFGTKSASSPARTLALLLMLAATLAIPSCGGSEESPTEEAGSKARAEQLVKDAGSNIEDLKQARDWMKEKIAAGDPDKLDLELLAEDTGRKIIKSFRALVGSLRESDGAKAKQFREWAQAIIDAEEGKPVGQRDPLANTLAREMDYLWELALKSDPNNADLRKKLGFIPHNKDLKAFRKLSFIDEDRDIKHIEDLIEAVAEDVRTSPDGKKWLPRDFSKAAEYKGIEEFVEKLKKAHEDKLKDPFTARAFEVLEETKAFLKKKDGLAEFEWVGRVHKPYLFVVERDRGWDETDVAAKKGKQLNELIDLFHSEYAETFKLEEVKQPLPIIVFKKAKSYQRYAVGKTLAGALGHFEHGTDRIVLSDQAQRGTLFHEGTHQLMTYHTKGDTIANFLSRSYWFQEGVAEYFGGTAVYVDKDTKELRFELGMLQSGRLGYWRQNEEQAYKLWDLIGLTFADRQINIAAGKQNKNLMVYSQGWLLVYFLYNFNVDADDVVQLSDTPKGKYKQGFLDYMKMELDGTSGREHFLKALGLWDASADKVDQAKWDKFETEFTRYYNWINRKLAMKYHVDNMKLIPWDKVENKRGRKIGEKIDDTLPEEEGD